MKTAKATRGSLIALMERNAKRDEMARRIVDACKRAGITIESADSSNGATAVNGEGTKYKITITHARDQGD